MDCVYRAYQAHLDFLGLEEHPGDYPCYKTLKLLSHDTKDEFLAGGVAPYIIGKVAEILHQLEALPYVVHDEFDRQFWLDLYRGDDPNSILRRSQVIGGKFLVFPGSPLPGQYFPAIYLLLQDQHAVFSETMPERGMPIMAIRLEYLT